MLWIVGKIFGDFQNYLDKNNIQYGVFADIHKPIRIDSTIPIVELDFSSHEAALTSLRNLAVRPKVTALMTAGYEQYVLPAAWLSEYFEVSGPTLAAARAATDKAVMRRAFADHFPEITPAYLSVSSWEDIESFMATHQFPVMLKPSNLMKSLYVTKNADIDELRRNYDIMTRELPKLKTTLGLTEIPGVVIEEFMAGSMHTVAAFVNSRRVVTFVPGIADCITAQNIGVQDNYLFSRTLPSTLSQDQQDAILQASSKGVEALGLSSTPMHIELILTATGPKIIEIGARIGGYRSRMYAYASGIDLYKASIDTAMDTLLNVEVTENKSCSFIELFSTTTGPFAGIRNQDTIENLASIMTATVKRKPGEIVGPAKDGFRAAMVIMLGHRDAATTQKDIDYIRANISVEIQ